MKYTTSRVNPNVNYELGVIMTYTTMVEGVDNGEAGHV
jgi:hypothetical protein